jgi:hypothetical protein
METIKISNIDNYSIIIKNGEMILTPIIRKITDDDLNIISLTHSNIIKTIIMNNEELISNKNKYNSILIDIYKSMPTQKIVQNTNMNIKLTNENGKKGYIFYPELNLSIQGKDANGTLKEIINLVKINNYKFDIYIRLETNELINYSFF